MSSPQIMKHMSANDIPLFAAYLFTPEGQSYTNWEFDVLIGDPEVPGAHFPPRQRKQAAYLNSLKIDAVGWLYSTPALIECKPNAGCGAIGQVLSYQKWYRVIFGVAPRMIIVCQRMSRQIRALCDLDAIDYRIVQPASDHQVQNAINTVRPLIKRLSILPEYEALG